jgi:unspecific monooxygenase
VTPQLVEEVLRFDPPLHLFTRFAYEDTTCFGFDIHKGQEGGLPFGRSQSRSRLCRKSACF